jgi:AcrR family transcriptional regulator
MAQFKKDEVRDAILNSAAKLFRKEGYTQIGLRAIAKDADVSLTSIYVYFNSKIDVLYHLYSPWFTKRIEKLRDDALAIPDPEKRLRFIVESLWRDIPREDGLAANLIEAVSTARLEDHYTPQLVPWARKLIGELISDSIVGHPILTPEKVPEFVYILLMAFDGFTINQRLTGSDTCTDTMIDIMCALLQARGPKKKIKGASRAQSGMKRREIA